ncbi:MAG: phage tail sheath family protein [Candidatus Metalachnospira sp.]|nr:phage tail sheath family protein [Candidatus Metalachnospira sp.]
MALGGGTYLTQNKVIPGTYINFVSAAKASATVSDRGYAAMALELDWGVDGEIFTVENADFQTDCKKIFGYDYTSDKLKGLRDLFINAKTLYCYRLNSGVKASNTYATAKYSGIRGNDIKIVIAANADDESKYDVSTVLDSKTVDVQTVANASGLKENDYVVFKSAATLAATAGTALAGGTNAAAVTGDAYQAFLDKIESYSFNTLGCLSTEDTVKGLFVAFTKRLRDEMGVKFQTVLYNKCADYEGVINLKNTVNDADAKESGLIYWLTGASAGCDVNKSITNKLYDGEFSVSADYKQSQLETFIKGGYFVFHKVGEEIRVLEDINSFTSVTTDKNDDFTANQIVRVLDQIGNDIAVIFNTKYLGKVQNDKDGRVALWGDIVTYCKELETIRALENVTSDDITVEQGNDKKSVVVYCPIMPVCAMSKLYMTVVVA